MKADSCPVAHHRLDGSHATRWDLAESADRLCPGSRTTTDLTAASRYAWKNSVRCIGRAQWKSLHVVDARSLTTPDEIFEALVHHLRTATNDGAIRSTKTIFRKWDGPEREIRVWNHQLIRYAGYIDGQKTLGDPQNREITRLAIELGWDPPTTRSRFDILPLIIQIDGKLHLYGLPHDAVLEVPLAHPRHEWFAELGLRWHAVPAISDMIFATGSEVYPCAPFNGHYMGTEIGARNFGDVARYNLLSEVAIRLGFETKRSETLWKDHALLVLNEAVLLSFRRAGVRITDHHKAADDFTKFCEFEKSRGSEPDAEWSWIVPPVAASATPVFHRSFECEPELPIYLLQKDAWETERGKELLRLRKS